MKDNGKFYATKNEQSWKRSTFKKCGLICKDNVSSNQKYLLENTWRWTLEKLIMVWPVSQFNFASITFMYFRILLSMLLTSAFFDKETISTFVLYYLKKIKRVDGWANTVFFTLLALHHANSTWFLSGDNYSLQFCDWPTEGGMIQFKQLESRATLNAFVIVFYRLSSTLNNSVL